MLNPLSFEEARRSGDALAFVEKVWRSCSELTYNDDHSMRGPLVVEVVLSAWSVYSATSGLVGLLYDSSCGHRIGEMLSHMELIGATEEAKLLTEIQGCLSGGAFPQSVDTAKDLADKLLEWEANKPPGQARLLALLRKFDLAQWNTLEPLELVAPWIETKFKLLRLLEARMRGTPP